MRSINEAIDFEISDRELSQLPPYQARPIQFLGLTDPASTGGWTLKRYGLSRHGGPVAESLSAMADAIAAERLPRPGRAAGRYGLGFQIVHEGREGGFVLLDWWVGENMLEHHVFFCPGPDHERHRELARTEPAFCVWEMAVIDHESRAWRASILANPAGPDVAAYLRNTIEEVY